MFNSNWNKDHKAFWKSALELNDEGLSNFQNELINEVKVLLNSNSIKYLEKTSKHFDLNDNEKIVKMITLSLIEYSESKIWIYNGMAEYDINKIHHIYEEWGYLTPNELQEKFLSGIRKILIAK